jgi:hypothetical protein
MGFLRAAALLAVVSAQALAQTPSGLIARPARDAVLGMRAPVSFEARSTGLDRPNLLYRWSLQSEATGRLLRLPQTGGPSGDGFSPSNRIIHVVLDRIPGARPGAWTLTLEARFEAAAPNVQTQRIPVHLFARTLTATGVSPGRLVAGSKAILYGRELAGARVELDGPISLPPGVAAEEDADGDAGRELVREKLVVNAEVDSNPLSARKGTSLEFRVPSADRVAPGLYRIAARKGLLRSRRLWLRIEPARIAPDPRPDRHGIARFLISGQTVRERFIESGAPRGPFWDYQIYWLAAVAGTRLDVTLERVDRSRSWEHPESIDPEIYVIAPDSTVYGHLVGRDVQPGADLNARLCDATLPLTGVYFVVAATTKGFGEYDLHFSLTPAEVPAPTDPILVSDPLRMIRSGAEARSVFLVLDRRGIPLSGAAVDFVGTAREAVLLEFPRGAAATSGVSGLTASTVRLDTPGLVGIPSQLHRCTVTDPLLVSIEAPAPQIPMPRVPLAGTATVMIRDVDLFTGEMALSSFSVDKL